MNQNTGLRTRREGRPTEDAEVQFVGVTVGCKRMANTNRTEKKSASDNSGIVARIRVIPFIVRNV